MDGHGRRAARRRERVLMMTRPPFRRLLWRCLRLRCPICGVGPLFRRGLTAHARCPHCGFRYARGSEYGQEGYFTGAMAINLVITGILPLIVVFALALTTDLPVLPLTVAGVVWVVVFPILFYRHAAALWVLIDHTLNPPSAAELAGQHEPASVASPLAADRDRLQGR
jgi:uncharacterized protein (DUF983 family)